MPIQEDLKNTTHKTVNQSAHTDGPLSAEINQLKRDTKGSSSNGKAALNENAHVTADYLSDLGDSLKKSGRWSLKKTEACIRAKPGQSLAVAFALSMLLCLLLLRSGS